MHSVRRMSMTVSSLPTSQNANITLHQSKQNQVGSVILYGVPIVSLVMENQERLCLAQISNTLLKSFSYNEIHNRRVALGITCVQCTPVQLEMLRRAGAMPVSSRRCGMITRREAERLCKSFLGDNSPPRLPDDFAFAVHHDCAWGCRGAFLPSRYNSSRAKCIKCSTCGLFFSPNKFIFHSHRNGPAAKYVQPDAANFNSWRRHMRLSGSPPEEVQHAWEDVKAMFNGGTRKRMLSGGSSHAAGGAPGGGGKSRRRPHSPPAAAPVPQSTAPRVPPLVMDYVWKAPLYPMWLPPGPLLLPPTDPKPPYPSAFTPVYPSPALVPPLSATPASSAKGGHSSSSADSDSEETVDIETCPEEEAKPLWSPVSQGDLWPTLFFSFVRRRWTSISEAKGFSRVCLPLNVNKTMDFGPGKVWRESSTMAEGRQSSRNRPLFHISVVRHRLFRNSIPQTPSQAKLMMQGQLEGGGLILKVTRPPLCPRRGFQFEHIHESDPFSKDGENLETRNKIPYIERELVSPGSAIIGPPPFKPVARSPDSTVPNLSGGYVEARANVIKDVNFVRIPSRDVQESRNNILHKENFYYHVDYENVSHEHRMKDFRHYSSTYFHRTDGILTCGVTRAADTKSKANPPHNTTQRHNTEPFKNCCSLNRHEKSDGRESERAKRD
ncbi:unnamed protein product, partial [Nesidiocoris tenuis]